jgi:hypothetical protein
MAHSLKLGVVLLYILDLTPDNMLVHNHTCVCDLLFLDGTAARTSPLSMHISPKGHPDKYRNFDKFEEYLAQFPLHSSMLNIVD